MKYNITNIESLGQLRDYLKEHYQSIENENASFVNYLIDEWDNGTFSKKLIELHEEELAQKIDDINPNQSRYEICKEICKIINDTSESISPTNSDSDNRNEFSWLDYYLTYDTYL